MCAGAANSRYFFSRTLRSLRVASPRDASYAPADASATKETIAGIGAVVEPVNVDSTRRPITSWRPGEVDLILPTLSTCAHFGRRFIEVKQPAIRP
jgi:hypothetical protein